MPADERLFNNEAISDKPTHKQQIYKQSPKMLQTLNMFFFWVSIINNVLSL